MLVRKRQQEPGEDGESADKSISDLHTELTWMLNTQSFKSVGIIRQSAPLPKDQLTHWSEKSFSGLCKDCEKLIAPSRLGTAGAH